MGSAALKVCLEGLEVRRLEPVRDRVRRVADGGARRGDAEKVASDASAERGSSPEASASRRLFGAPPKSSVSGSASAKAAEKPARFWTASAPLAEPNAEPNFLRSAATHTTESTASAPAAAAASAEPGATRRRLVFRRCFCFVSCVSGNGDPGALSPAIGGTIPGGGAPPRAVAGAPVFLPAGAAGAAADAAAAALGMATLGGASMSTPGGGGCSRMIPRATGGSPVASARWCLRPSHSAMSLCASLRSSPLALCACLYLRSSSSTYCFLRWRDSIALSRLRTKRARFLSSLSSSFSAVVAASAFCVANVWESVSPRERRETEGPLEATGASGAAANIASAPQRIASAPPGRKSSPRSPTSASRGRASSDPAPRSPGTSSGGSGRWSIESRDAAGAGHGARREASERPLSRDVVGFFACVARCCRDEGEGGMRGSDARGEGRMGEVRSAREEALGIHSCARHARKEGCGKLWFDTRSASETTVGDAPNRRTRRPWPHRASPRRLRRFLRRVACFARLTTGGPRGAEGSNIRKQRCDRWTTSPSSRPPPFSGRIERVSRCSARLFSRARQSWPITPSGVLRV